MTTTWNPADKAAAITLSNGDLSAASSVNDRTVRSTSGFSVGKKYFEIRCNTPGTGGFAGLSDGARSLDERTGLNADSFGWANTGTIFKDGSAGGSGVSYTTNDILGFACDFDADKLYVHKNGTYAFGTNPTTASGFVLAAGVQYFAAVTPYASCLYTANFGATNFAYSMPAGFSDWDPGGIAHALAAAAGGEAGASADLLIGRHMEAAAASIASASATMAKSAPLAAAAAALATADGILRVQRSLGANAQEIATATGNLSIGKHLQAASSALAVATAGVNVTTPGVAHLGANAVVQPVVDASLRTLGYLTAAATSIASAQAGLRQMVRLGAAASAEATAGAELRAGLPPRPLDPPPRQTETTWLSVVMEAEPEFQRLKHKELEYKFERRRFYGDPYRRGPYGPRKTALSAFGITTPAATADLRAIERNKNLGATAQVEPAVSANLRAETPVVIDHDLAATAVGQATATAGLRAQPSGRQAMGLLLAVTRAAAPPSGPNHHLVAAAAAQASAAAALRVQSAHLEAAATGQSGGSAALNVSSAQRKPVGLLLAVTKAS